MIHDVSVEDALCGTLETVHRGLEYDAVLRANRPGLFCVNEALCSRLSASCAKDARFSRGLKGRLASHSHLR